MKALVLVGIAASGKSTFAAQMVLQHDYVEINRDYIRFNIVLPGSDWRTYKHTKARENEVTKVAEQLLMDAWAREKNVVLSDVNLKKGKREALVKRLTDLGYEVEVKVFHVTREEAVKRDNYRLNGVGEGTIYKQMQQYNEMWGRRTYTPDESLPKAVVYDIDGTIAKMVDRGPFEWSKVGNDNPRQFVIDMLKSHAKQGYEIIVCSGRSDECLYETEMWLNRYVGSHYFSELHMRKEGDFRKDSVVKEEIFWTKLADRYNIEAVVDDRDQMIALWYELKIENVICVGDPYISF